MKYQTGLISLAVCLLGCATAKYVPSATAAPRPPKEFSQVPLFYSTKDVSFEFSEMGRIIMDNTYYSKRDQIAQINKIRKKAAELGADGVIILRQFGTESSGSFVGGIGGYSTDQIYQVEGVVIIKK